MIVSGHKRAWEQTWVGTNVSGHKFVWAQTCVGTIVSGHKFVWAQTFVGTVVWAQSSMTQTWWKPNAVYSLYLYAHEQIFYMHA